MSNTSSSQQSFKKATQHSRKTSSKFRSNVHNGGFSDPNSNPMTGESFENSQPPTGRFMPSTRRQQSLASQTSANQLIEMCHAAASQTKEELKQYDEDLERHVSIDRKLKKVNRIKSPLNQTIPFA